jgi:hypothetical protein
VIQVSSPVSQHFSLSPAGRGRKRKGIARVRLAGGSIHLAEIHWYEAGGIGRKEFKIKYLL